MYIVKEDNKLGYFVEAVDGERNYLTFYCEPKGIKVGAIVDGELDHYHFFMVTRIYQPEKHKDQSNIWTPKSHLTRFKRFLSIKVNKSNLGLS